MRLATLSSVAVIAIATAVLAQVTAPVEQKIPAGNSTISGNAMMPASGPATANSTEASPSPRTGTPSNTTGDPVDASDAPKK